MPLTKMLSSLKQFFQKDRNFLIFIFIFGFVLRLIYLLEIKDNPHFYNLTLDPLYHDTWAKQIAGGDWIGNQVFFRAPFYPYFLAVLYKIFGHHLFLVSLIQHLIGCISVILIFRVAKKLFDRKVAILASTIAATYWIFIYYEAELLLDFL
ncbi:MAG TPA: glycosyltransferase family 39 protein, partial [candidate division Zixibacteria bacterium]|nr:glycosyltransferase family 39 protein [candidate division Zixibacteria bacterium]